MLPNVLYIWTDGGCPKSGGHGGWAAVLQWNGHRREINGYEPATTNNRMELTAAIMALERVRRPVPIIIYTDSQYLQKGITLWCNRWSAKRWKDVKNPDLWKRLMAIDRTFDTTWEWVRGHNGDPGNERADELATQAMQFKRSTTNSWGVQEPSSARGGAGAAPALANRPRRSSDGLGPLEA